MDLYIFEKLVRARDDIFYQSGKKEWTIEWIGFLYEGGILGLCFKWYAEVSSIWILH